MLDLTQNSTVVADLIFRSGNALLLTERIHHLVVRISDVVIFLSFGTHANCAKEWRNVVEGTNDLSHFHLFLDLELDLRMSCRMMRESWFSSTPNGPGILAK